uniref:protein MAINTENANCE OF PSII UNDER HIGH LIGHT 1 n=1 Tax=Erigeron canadensis TaxID=72917 RepID=UPI001CB90F05|nr:protein MAINTENANCE OF PSII UNDER HIGH LIGHT 1 [Erigeron canadensis]
MGSSSAALSASSSCSTNMRTHFLFDKNKNFVCKKRQNHLKIIRASDDSQEDCNVEECAPDKEVGKVSMEWLAGEKTKVAGTFPPRRRDWSGYVEKDTAGQTNIYSVEPAVYVAESAISSGTSGMSADGSENTAALVGFGGLLAVAAASVVLLQVGKNPPPIQTLDYSGPSLSYYITKFKPSEIVQVSVPTEPEPTAQPESSTPQVVDSESSETETALAEQPEGVTQQEPEVEVGSG